MAKTKLSKEEKELMKQEEKQERKFWNTLIKITKPKGALISFEQFPNPNYLQ